MRENRITLHINVDRDLIDRFDRLYPSCRRRFVENSIRLATNSKEVFDKIFFCDLLSNNDSFNHSL